jgi:transposase
MKVTRNDHMELMEKPWQILQKLRPRHKIGRKPLDRWRIIHVLFDLVRTGCPWRNLPKCFPKRKTIYTQTD